MNREYLRRVAFFYEIKKVMFQYVLEDNLIHNCFYLLINI